MSSKQRILKQKSEERFESSVCNMITQIMWSMDAIARHSHRTFWQKENSEAREALNLFLHSEDFLEVIKIVGASVHFENEDSDNDIASSVEDRIDNFLFRQTRETLSYLYAQCMEEQGCCSGSIARTTLEAVLISPPDNFSMIRIIRDHFVLKFGDEAFSKIRALVENNLNFCY